MNVREQIEEGLDRTLKREILSYLYLGTFDNDEHLFVWIKPLKGSDKKEALLNLIRSFED